MSVLRASNLNVRMFNPVLPSLLFKWSCSGYPFHVTSFKRTFLNKTMTDESNIEFVGKVKAEKLTTLAEDSKNELAEI